MIVGVVDGGEEAEDAGYVRGGSGYEVGERGWGGEGEREMSGEETGGGVRRRGLGRGREREDEEEREHGGGGDGVECGGGALLRRRRLGWGLHFWVRSSVL